MPVNGQLVSVMYAYGFYGVPQTFDAKGAAPPDTGNVGEITHQRLRRYKAYRSILFWMFGL